MSKLNATALIFEAKQSMFVKLTVQIECSEFEDFFTIKDWISEELLLDATVLCARNENGRSYLCYIAHEQNFVDSFL